MDRIVLDWAQDRLRDEVGALADDPHGYCCDEISPAEAWQRIEHIARELGMDAVAVLRGEATQVEISRLERLTQRSFA